MNNSFLHHHEVHGDPGVHANSLLLFADLKTRPQGYMACMEMLTNGCSHDDTVKYIFLNVIKNTYLKKQYKDATEEERDTTQEFLVKYINTLQTHFRFDSRNVRYVAARIYVLVFLADYLHHWDDYFSVIVDSMSTGLKTVDHSVRVLHMISYWMSKEDVPPCTSFDVKEKELIKSKFEKNDLRKIVKFLYFVMMEYHQIVVESLKVLCELITWVDSNCFTYSPVLDVIAGSMADEKTEDLAMNCFIELTKSRTSEPVEKYYLIEKMIGITEEHWTRVQQDRVKNFVYYRYCEFLKEVGKQLILSYKMCIKNELYCDAQVILASIESRITDVITVMNTYDHSVIAVVIEFPILYVKHLADIATPSETQQTHVNQLLIMCVTQMKCPFYMDMAHATKYDLFRDYRKQVSLLLQALTGFSKNLVVGCVGDQVERLSLGHLNALEPYNDIELSIYLLQILCETLPMKRDSSNKNSLVTMFQTLVTSGLDTHPHPAVVIQYFYTIVSGVEYFITYPLAVPHLLESFLIRSGNNHSEEVVRGNCAYLFHQIVTRLQYKLTHHAQYIMEHLTPHLVLNEKERQGQLHLYATYALVIQAADMSGDHRQSHLEQLLAQPFSQFRCAMSQWYRATTDTYRDQLSAAIRQTIDIVTHTTHAFADHAALANTHCTSNYVNAFSFIQHGLQLVSTRQEIHASMMSLIERLIIVLEDQLIPFLPTITQGLCSSNETGCVSETIRILILIIDKYNRKIVPFLKEEFQRIGHCIYLPYAIAYNTSRDVQTRHRFKADLEHKYILYVISLIRNEIFDDVFLQEDKAPLLNILYMIACGCLPTLKVEETKMRAYARFLQTDEGSMDKEMQIVVGEVKRLFMEEADHRAVPM